MSEEADIESFLKSFFNGTPGENRFSYENIKKGHKEAYIAIRQWLHGLRNPPHSTVLPRYREIDGKNDVTWYGLATNDRTLRRLIDEVRAFVGPTYSDFTGQQTSLDTDDPIEVVVDEFAGGSAFTFQGNNEKIRDALVLMHEVRSQQKQRDVKVYRSPGLILRDFHMALAAQNEEAAREALQYMHGRSLISTLNRDFLQIQLHREFRQWNAVLDMDLEDILVVRRPLAVTEALIQAVYHYHLKSFEETNDAEGALEQYQEVVQPSFGSLFGMRSTMRAPEVLKAFMLKAVSPDTADAGLRANLLEEAEACELDLPFLRDLAELGGKVPTTAESEAPSVHLDEAKRAYDKGDFDRAYDVAIQLDATAERAEILLRCSYELQSTEAHQATAHAINALPEADRDSVLDRRLYRKIYEDITAQAGAKAQNENVSVPDNWIAWLRRLEIEPDWNRSRALEIAKRGVREWDVEDLLSSHENAVQKLVDALGTESGAKAERTLVQALPHLISFFQQDSAYPRPDMQPVYEHMLILVAITPDKGEADLDLFYILCQTLLTQGVTKKQYKEIIDYATYVWGEVAAPHHMTWSLDFIDLLVMFPQLDAEASLRFVQCVIETFQQYSGRAEREEIETLQRLCKELGHSDVFVGFELEEQEQNEDDPLQHLEDESIVIYTLTEQAGARMKKLLEDMCEGVSVRLSDSKVATDRLKKLSRNADIFIMVTASAAHAATNYIREKRQDRPTVVPRGKGTSSMIRALRSYLRKNEGNVHA